MTLSSSQVDFIATIRAGTITTSLERNPQAKKVVLCKETPFTELKSSNEIFIGH